MEQSPKFITSEISEFRRLVYDATCGIPPSKAATYGWVVARIGRGSPRAVGGALRTNPFAPGVPCHRVVSADGSLNGFGGSRQSDALARKRRLLENEGVVFTAEGRVSPASLLQ